MVVVRGSFPLVDSVIRLPWSLDSSTRLGVAMSIIAIVVLASFTYWKLAELERDLIESNAIENAEQYSAAIREFRTVYTSEVVANAQKQGLLITHDYQNNDNAIPLPTTLSLLLGNRLAAQGGGSTRLYSDHPFPWRLEELGPISASDKETLESLRRDPYHPVFRLDTVSASPSIRFATADQMRADCVGCHNSHPDSPKRDWKPGDVRGVVEVSLPLDSVIARTHASFLALWVLLGSATAVIAIVVTYLGGVIIQRSKVMLERQQSLEDEQNLRARIERDLEYSEVDKSFILDSADEAIIAMDRDGIITVFNHAAEKIFGYSRDTAIGSTVSELIIPPDSREAHERGVARVLATGEQQLAGQRVELQAMRADGALFPVELSLTVIERDGENSFIACLHDSSERNQRETELRKALQEAKESRIELEAFNHFSVDREIRMISLKEEINALLAATGGAPKYVIPDTESDLEAGRWGPGSTT